MKIPFKPLLIPLNPSVAPILIGSYQTKRKSTNGIVSFSPFESCHPGLKSSARLTITPDHFLRTYDYKDNLQQAFYLPDLLGSHEMPQN